MKVLITTDYYIRSVSINWLYPNTRYKLFSTHRFIKELIEWHPDVILD